MLYTGYKLDFKTAVHFGSGNLSDSGNRLMADTIFSALCHEAVKYNELDLLIKFVEQGKIRISDAFPCNENTYYLPKPMLRINTESDSEIKKKAKKLEYVSTNKFKEYLEGKMDISMESNKLSEMGFSEIRTNTFITTGEDAKPYSVGTYCFRENWGLYIIVGYVKEENLNFIENLLISLSYSGIGGKRSSGLGKFELNYAKLPRFITENLVNECSQSRVMTLSTSMCQDDVLEEVLEDARCSLVKRSGFVSSETFALQAVKKQDFYCFQSGSVFTKCFKGQLKDVSKSGSHPVYRYAFPMFLEVLKSE